MLKITLKTDGKLCKVYKTETANEMSAATAEPVTVAVDKNVDIEQLKREIAEGNGVISVSKSTYDELKAALALAGGEVRFAEEEEIVEEEIAEEAEEEPAEEIVEEEEESAEEEPEEVAEEEQAEEPEEEVVEDEPAEEVEEQEEAEEQPAEEPAEEVEEEQPAEEVIETVAATAEEEEEEVVREVDEETGMITVTRFRKSFRAKLIQAPEEAQKYYETLKNALLSYQKVTSRESWNYDSINLGRSQLAKLNVRGKTLYLYLALKAENFAESKYKVEKVESKKYADVPCLYRIRNDRREGYALELIAQMMEQKGVAAGEQQNVNYRLPYESTDKLVEEGLIKKVVTQEKA